MVKKIGNRDSIQYLKSAIAFLVISTLMVIMIAPAVIAKENRSPENKRTPDTKIAIWSELVPFSGIREMLPLLLQYDLDLHLNISPDDVGSAELAQLLLEADNSEVIA